MANGKLVITGDIVEFTALGSSTIVEGTGNNTQTWSNTISGNGYVVAAKVNILNQPSPCGISLGYCNSFNLHLGKFNFGLDEGEFKLELIAPSIFQINADHDFSVEVNGNKITAKTQNYIHFFVPFKQLVILLNKLCMQDYEELQLASFSSEIEGKVNTKLMVGRNVVLAKSIDVVKGRNYFILNASEVKTFLNSIVTPQPDVQLNLEYGGVVEKSLIKKLIFMQPDVSVKSVYPKFSSFCANSPIELLIKVENSSCKAKLKSKVFLGKKLLNTTEFSVDANYTGIVSLPVIIASQDVRNYGIDYTTLKNDTILQLSVDLERIPSSVETKFTKKTKVAVFSSIIPITLKPPGYLFPVSVSFPKYARPGYTSGFSMVLENVGKCKGDFVVRVKESVSNKSIFSNSYHLSPLQKTTISDVFIALPSDFSIDMDINRVEVGRLYNIFNFSKGIQIDNVVKLDRNKGVFFIRSGGTPLRYSFLIIGKDIKGSNIASLEKINAGVLSVLPLIPNNAALIYGILDSHSEQQVTFTSLNYLKGKTSYNVTWVVDKSILQKSTSSMEYGDPISIGLSKEIFKSQLKMVER